MDKIGEKLNQPGMNAILYVVGIFINKMLIMILYRCRYLNLSQGNQSFLNTHKDKFSAELPLFPSASNLE